MYAQSLRLMIIKFINIFTLFAENISNRKNRIKNSEVDRVNNAKF